MKKLIFPLFLLFNICLQAQNIPGDYPDTLWIYGSSNDPEYGLVPEKPIKVGGGKFPKSNYRYLNNLTDLDGNPIEFDRQGSFTAPNKRPQPLTAFNIRPKGTTKWTTIYFDQYEWDYPKLIAKFGWSERRTGYHGYYANDSTFNGYGLYFFEDGGYYKGQWENGVPHGQGTIHVVDTEEYTGTFKNGEYNGYGVLLFLDGGRYEGEWLNGKKDGLGKIFYPPGDEIKYIEGKFEDNNPKGTFKVFNANGTIETHSFD